MITSSHLAQLEEPHVTAGRVFSLVSAELQLVEREFERQARSNIQVISYIGDYLRASGGKRVRPALTLLAAAAAGGDPSRTNVVRMATVMEFLHTATLVHDDIIDNAETRRSRASINSRFGNQTAVLMGDWLYMTAFETSLQERSLQVLDILTAVTRRMTEGELLQLTSLGRADVSEEQYFDILLRKTAHLFSACCEIGAILGGGDRAAQEALADYGLNLGAAFQLVDDLLDFTASGDALGKPAGVDLLEGKLTLPLIYLLAHEAGKREAIQTVMREGGYNSIPRARLVEAAEGCGALEEARARARDFAVAAQTALDTLPESEHKEALLSLPTFILERDR